MEQSFSRTDIKPVHNISLGSIDMPKNNDRNNISILILNFHHIYSDTKITEILKKAKILGVRGCICPGTPGVVIIEGNEKALRDMVECIRELKWFNFEILTQYTRNSLENSTVLKEFSIYSPKGTILKEILQEIPTENIEEWNVMVNAHFQCPTKPIRFGHYIWIHGIDPLYSMNITYSEKRAAKEAKELSLV